MRLEKRRTGKRRERRRGQGRGGKEGGDREEEGKKEGTWEFDELGSQTHRLFENGSEFGTLKLDDNIQQPDSTAFLGHFWN